MTEDKKLFYLLLAGINVILVVGLFYYHPPPAAEAQPVCVPARPACRICLHLENECGSGDLNVTCTPAFIDTGSATSPPDTLHDAQHTSDDDCMSITLDCQS